MKIHLITLALLMPPLVRAQEANPFVKSGAQEEAGDPVQDDLVAGTLRFRIPSKLLPADSKPVDAAASELLLARAWKWVEEGKAVLEDTAIVTGSSGERFITESISEVCHPTEWLPAPAGAWPGPQAIETRNTGFTQEWEPMLEGNSVLVNSALDHVRLAGCNDYHPLVKATRQPDDMTSAIFESDRTTWNSRMPRGAWTLVARYDGGGPDESSRLCFARIDSRARKPAPAMKEEVTGIRGVLEWIEVDHPSFAAWWAKTPVTEAATGAHAEADRMLAAGRGSAVSSMPFQCQFENRVSTGSLREVRYPTDFDPPYTTPVTAPAPVPADGATAPEQSSPAAGVMPDYPVEGFGAAWNGVAYQTRNTGVSAEIEVSPAGRGLYSVRLSAESVKQVSEIVMRRIKVKDQWIPDVSMPRFYAEKISTGLRLEPGTPVLVGVLAPPDASGNPDPAKRHLIFLTVNPEK